MTRTNIEFRDRLLALWHEWSDSNDNRELNQEDFASWDGATKDLLMSMGMEWDNSKNTYVFVNRETTK